MTTRFRLFIVMNGLRRTFSDISQSDVNRLLTAYSGIVNDCTGAVTRITAIVQPMGQPTGRTSGEVA